MLPLTHYLRKDDCDDDFRAMFAGARRSRFIAPQAARSEMQLTYRTFRVDTTSPNTRQKVRTTDRPGRALAALPACEYSRLMLSSIFLAITHF